MEILRVFNNNVVLARGQDGSEVVLTGRGLGFQAKPGGTVDESKVARTFVPVAVAFAGGMPAERIGFHGNNKSVAEIERAIEGGVGTIILDSEE